MLITESAYVIPNVDECPAIMGGVEALRQVRDARIDMPVIALTASVQDELQVGNGATSQNAGKLKQRGSSERERRARVQEYQEAPGVCPGPFSNETMVRMRGMMWSAISTAP
jgi:CheY-like chemotaxis protein